MKKYHILLVAWLLIGQSGLTQNIDSTKIDVFMLKVQVEGMDLDVDFIPSFVKTPNQYIFLSSEKALYVLGKEGIIPVTPASRQVISSFTITPGGDLYAILDDKLCLLDSVNNFQEVITLPDNKMKLSAGKNALYIYNSETATRLNKHAIYKLFPDNNHQKIIETPAPINAVLEVEEYLLFTTENKLYAIDVSNKAYRELASLKNQKEKIISMSMDYSTQSLYFASPTAIFRIRDSKLDCVYDQFGGLLQCDEAGLIVFSPTESFIVRIRHNALFPVKSQEVTSPQQQIVSATNATISVTTIFSITQQNQFASINLSSFFK